MLVVASVTLLSKATTKTRDVDNQRSGRKAISCMVALNNIVSLKTISNTT
jgi:hypothetical protein